jgi:hypothetical protein
MCLFTGDVTHVSDTNIFARGADDRQILVYSMDYAADSPLAMVLPIPVVPGSPEGALRFISLENCGDLFGELRNGFRSEEEQMLGDARDMLGGVTEAPRTLEVLQVGAFEASFVPRPEDFGRLDERFRLPAEIWLELKHYRDWGFAVFKLKETRRAHAHPMAFDFPRRDPSRLFFPTLHLHHRRLDRYAAFDHTLYCQPEPALNWHLQQWQESDDMAQGFVECAEAQPLFDLFQTCWRVQVSGKRENRDTWLGRGETIPAWA